VQSTFAGSFPIAASPDQGKGLVQSPLAPQAIAQTVDSFNQITGGRQRPLTWLAGF
jgi:hypothetical protein